MRARPLEWGGPVGCRRGYRGGGVGGGGGQGQRRSPGAGGLLREKASVWRYAASACGGDMRGGIWIESEGGWSGRGYEPGLLIS